MKDTIGIDISKATLDVYRLSTNDAAQFSNTTAGLRALGRWIGGRMPDLVVYEGQTMGLAVPITPPLSAASRVPCRS